MRTYARVCGSLGNFNACYSLRTSGEINLPKVIQPLSNETKIQSDLKAYVLSTRHDTNSVLDRNCVLSPMVLTTHYWDHCPFFILRNVVSIWSMQQPLP